MMPFSIRQVLEAAGGSIVGKVRLQKVVYLLDQIGMDSGLEFDYHHYGPYSAALADYVDEEKSSGLVEERFGQRESDGVAYSVFAVPGAVNNPSATVGDLDFAAARKAVALMQKRSSTVLELAATIHWLDSVERYADWHAELVSRKGIKTAKGRDGEALQLLKELGLAPVGR